MKVILLFLIMLFFTLPSEACTMCNSTQATEVRAVVFGDDFYKNIFFTVLAFIAFSAIVVYIYKNGKSIKS
jgi:hypothetical protein